MACGANGPLHTIDIASLSISPVPTSNHSNLLYILSTISILTAIRAASWCCPSGPLSLDPPATGSAGASTELGCGLVPFEGVLPSSSGEPDSEAFHYCIVKALEVN